MGQPLTLDEVGVEPDSAAQVIYDLRAWQRAALRTFGYIAESCNHVSDEPDEPVDNETHLHDPGDGGHHYCGPCAAYRALKEVAT